MTLVVMPTIYALMDDLAGYLRRVTRAMRPAPRQTVQPTLGGGALRCTGTDGCFDTSAVRSMRVPGTARVDKREAGW